MTIVLTRKINAAKWHPAADLAMGEVSADAVTSDLRTTANELSFWVCPSNDDAELRETVLALAAAGDRLDKLDVAWIQLSATSGLTVNKSPQHALIPIESLKERHVDVANLDLVRLGKVATLVHSAVAGSQFKRFAKREVLAVVVAAVRNGRVKASALKDSLRQDVEQALQKAAKTD